MANLLTQHFFQATSIANVPFEHFAETPLLWTVVIFFITPTFPYSLSPCESPQNFIEMVRPIQPFLPDFGMTPLLCLVALSLLTCRPR